MYPAKVEHIQKKHANEQKKNREVKETAAHNIADVALQLLVFVDYMDAEYKLMKESCVFVV